jgi:hypothetical protein
MADKKITQLAELSILSDDDLVAGVDLDNNITSKIAISTLKDYIDTTYIGGEGISIDGNVISATGGTGGGTWGSITGNIEDQTDLMNLIGDIGEAIDLINGEEI